MDSLKTEKIKIAKQADVFITKTATQTLTNTAVVEKVMNFHFRDLLRAFKTYSSIEISGFGKFEISQSKLMTRLKDFTRIRGLMQKQLENGTYFGSLGRIQERLANLDRDIAYLEERKKGDETKFQGYFRRMEESLASTREAERINPANQ